MAEFPIEIGSEWTAISTTKATGFTVSIPSGPSFYFMVADDLSDDPPNWDYSAALYHDGRTVFSIAIPANSTLWLATRQADIHTMIERPTEGEGATAIAEEAKQTADQAILAAGTAGSAASAADAKATNAALAAASASASAANALTAAGLPPEAFGAIGDGVTNDRVAVQAALDAATAAGRELVLTKRYLIGGDITVASGAKIRAVNGILDDCTLRMTGSYGASTNLTSAIGAGVSAIPVVNTAGFAAGDYIRIVSCINSQAPSAGDYILGDRRDANPASWLSENARIAKVDATTIYIDGRTVFPYSITPDADSGGRTATSVYKLNLVDNVQVTGLTVRRTTTLMTQSPVYIEYTGPDVRFNRCTFDCSAATYLYARPIYMGMCYGTKFSACTFLGIKVEPLVGSQGNAEIRSCQDVWFQDCTVIGGNQGLDITPGAYPVVGGPCMGCRIENCRFEGTYTDAVTTHWGCLGTIIRGNVVRCKSGNGIRIRSKNDVVEDNDIQGSPGGSGSGVFISNIPMRGMIVRRNRIVGFRDQVLLNILFEASFTPTSWPSGQVGVDISDNDLTAVTGGRDCIRVDVSASASPRPVNVRVQGNVLKMMGTPASISGVRLTKYANGCAVVNNEIRNFTNGIFIEKDCIEGVIEGNRIIDCAGSSIRGTTATGNQVEDTATFGALANAGFAVQRNYYIRSPSHSSIPANFTGLAPASIA